MYIPENIRDENGLRNFVSLDFLLGMRALPIGSDAGKRKGDYSVPAEE